MIMRVLLPLLIFLAASEPAGTTVEVKLRALAFDSPVLHLGLSTAHGGKKDQPLEVYGHAWTQEYTVACKEGVLKILRPTIDEKGKPAYADYASTTVPPAGGRMLLIINGTQAKGSLALLPDDALASAGGSMRFFNLTSKPLRVVLPGGEYPLPPGGNALLRPTVKDEIYGQGQILAERDGAWQTARSLRWLQQDDVRTFYFILPEPHDPTQVRLRGIEERILKETLTSPLAAPAGKEKGK